MVVKPIQRPKKIIVIHRTSDKCSSASGQISCLRRATAATALKIANQSINAVSIVESAKKNLTGEN